MNKGNINVKILLGKLPVEFSVAQDLCCAARQSLLCYGGQFYEIMQCGEVDLSALECADMSKTWA